MQAIEKVGEGAHFHCRAYSHCQFYFIVILIFIVKLVFIVELVLIVDFIVSSFSFSPPPQEMPSMKTSHASSLTALSPSGPYISTLVSGFVSGIYTILTGLGGIEPPSLSFPSYLSLALSSASL